MLLPATHNIMQYLRSNRDHLSDVDAMVFLAGLDSMFNGTYMYICNGPDTVVRKGWYTALTRFCFPPPTTSLGANCLTQRSWCSWPVSIPCLMVCMQWADIVVRYRVIRNIDQVLLPATHNIMQYLRSQKNHLSDVEAMVFLEGVGTMCNGVHEIHDQSYCTRNFHSSCSCF